MKSRLMLLASFLAVSAFAQSTLTIQMPGEGAVSVTLSAQAIPSMISYIENAPAAGVAGSTLTAAATSAATTMTVAALNGATTGMGLCFGTAPSCTEVDLITGISSLTLTLTRATLGTTAAAYSSGQAFTYLQSGDGSEWLANVMKATITQAMTSFPGPTIAAANAAIATQSATITSTVAAGFTKTP
jgi:hypothetical protein